MSSEDEVSGALFWTTNPVPMVHFSSTNPELSSSYFSPFQSLYLPDHPVVRQKLDFPLISPFFLLRSPMKGTLSRFSVVFVPFQPTSSPEKEQFFNFAPVLSPSTFQFILKRNNFSILPQFCPFQPSRHAKEAIGTISSDIS